MAKNMQHLRLKDPLAVHLEEAADLEAGGGIVIDTTTGVITELVASGQQPRTAVEKTFDASGHVITPGLVNTHHHFYQTLTRAWPPVASSKLFTWLVELYLIWALVDAESMRLASQVAMAELLESGCTTTADHHYLFPDGGQVTSDTQVEVARELGMRAVVTRGSTCGGADDGGLLPSGCGWPARSPSPSCWSRGAPPPPITTICFPTAGKSPSIRRWRWLVS